MALALEVVGGPMDGLRTLIRDGNAQTLLGRQVGNHLSLPFDMTISRWHASVAKEGNDYYLTDESSLSGTWVDGSRINKTQLFCGMVLMVGGTIVEVIDISESQGNIVMEDTFFNDPLQTYQVSDFLAGILKKLRQQQDNYLTLSNIFQHSEFRGHKNLNRYDGIKKLSSVEFKKEVSRWTGREVAPKYRFMNKDQFITPPRIWSVFDIASNSNTKKINTLEFIDAVLTEQRSLTARILRQDALFIKRVAEKSFDPPQKKTGSPAISGESDQLIEILANAIIKIERIISGFIEDAVSSGLGKGESSKPDLDLKAAAKNLNQTAQSDLSDRIQVLEKNMVALLAAHRDALASFEQELGNRIYQALEQEEHKGKFPALSNSGASVSSAVKRVLKEAQLEGLSGHIVRNAIKDKVIF